MDSGEVTSCNNPFISCHAAPTPRIPLSPIITASLSSTIELHIKLYFLVLETYSKKPNRENEKTFKATTTIEL